ncbi:MAG: transposase, partial [Phycisphaerae bacterium]
TRLSAISSKQSEAPSSLFSICGRSPRWGLPVSASIADGSRHDVRLVEQALDEALTDTLSPILIGDKAFDSRQLRESLDKERHISLIAPKRRGRGSRGRNQDGRRMRRYRRRWKVERLFAWLKQFRRIAVRWDRSAENYLGFVHLGCVVILLRQLTAGVNESRNDFTRSRAVSS